MVVLTSGRGQLSPEVTHGREVWQSRPLSPFPETQGQPSRGGLVAIPAWPEVGDLGQRVPMGPRGLPAGAASAFRPPWAWHPPCPTQSELSPANLRGAPPTAPAPWATVDPCRGHGHRPSAENSVLPFREGSIVERPEEERNCKGGGGKKGGKTEGRRGEGGREGPEGGEKFFFLNCLGH